MKPDKLEQFVLDNRSDFDDMSPSPESWEKVKGNIKPMRQINWTSRLVRVAAAIVIFVSSYIFIDYTVNKNNDSPLQAAGPNMEFYENIPVLVEARAYYSSQISNMEDEVYQLAGTDSPVRNDIEIEFDELDQVFDELKADLSDDAANEEVIEAMIQNYRIKLQILEEILIQLKNADTQNTIDHEDKKVLL
jgi:hypothetical protein